MSFGVFLHREDSPYDDSPAERYHFPRGYLTRVGACVGSWILYLEPSKVRGTRGYFAAARVGGVEPDPARPGLFFAAIEPGSYLDFARTVPFRDQDGVVETGLLNEAGRISGRAQSAVRPISAADFQRILSRGLADEAAPLPRLDPAGRMPGLHEPQAPFLFERERERTDMLISRPLRDRVFRQVVLDAYGSRCAITGLRLINGGGRAEVEAAHIRPV